MTIDIEEKGWCISEGKSHDGLPSERGLWNQLKASQNFDVREYVLNHGYSPRAGVVDVYIDCSQPIETISKRFISQIKNGIHEAVTPFIVLRYDMQVLQPFEGGKICDYHPVHKLCLNNERLNLVKPKEFDS